MKLIEDSPVAQSFFIRLVLVPRGRLMHLLLDGKFSHPCCYLQHLLHPFRASLSYHSLICPTLGHPSDIYGCSKLIGWSQFSHHSSSTPYLWNIPSIWWMWHIQCWPHLDYHFELPPSFFYLCQQISWTSSASFIYVTKSINGLYPLHYCGNCYQQTISEISISPLHWLSSKAVCQDTSSTLYPSVWIF